MVRHAAAAHAALAPRLRFLCTDIAARHLPATPLGALAAQLQGFHKVFSFFVLNWVPDQRTAFRNISTLLRPGGEALLVMVASSPIYAAFMALKNDPRWANYTQDASCHISPYHYSSDPVSDFSKSLQQANFHIHATRLELHSHSYITMQDFSDGAVALNPFLKRIPGELQTMHIADFMRELQMQTAKFLSVDFSKNFERNNTILYYSVLIAHVEKTTTMPRTLDG